MSNLSLTSVSAGAPRLLRLARAADDGSPRRLECIHVGLSETRGVAEVLAELLLSESADKLLTGLLMGPARCLPVRSETPLFTSPAHVRELNQRGEAVRRLGSMGNLEDSRLFSLLPCFTSTCVVYGYPCFLEL